jgi:hypothetical protein
MTRLLPAANLGMTIQTLGNLGFTFTGRVVLHFHEGSPWRAARECGSAHSSSMRTTASCARMAFGGSCRPSCKDPELPHRTYGRDRVPRRVGEPLMARRHIRGFRRRAECCGEPPPPGSFRFGRLPALCRNGRSQRLSIHRNGRTCRCCLYFCS